jgi:phosphoribosylglycinamide formyltransferase 1
MASTTPDPARTAPRRTRAVVVLSGQGTNFRALHDATLRGGLPLDVVAVFSDRAAAAGLELARERSVPAFALDPKSFADRAAFDAALASAIEQQAPEWVFLAGYMRILSAAFVAQFAGRLLNIHPSLLPDYPGLHTHRRALADGRTVHGATVHFVTAELDGGPPIAQSQVPVERGDTEETLSARVQVAEHILYPTVARWAALGRLRWNGGRPELDGAPLVHPVPLTAGRVAEEET